MKNLLLKALLLVLFINVSTSKFYNISMEYIVEIEKSEDSKKIKYSIDKNDKNISHKMLSIIEKNDKRVYKYYPLNSYRYIKKIFKPPIYYI